MANEKNLIPFSERTESERREISKKAGKASGEARRKKRDAKAAAKYLLNLPTADVNKSNMRKMGIPEDEDGDTNMMALMARMMLKGLSGDERAVRLLLELAGEDPKSKADAERLRMEKARFKAEQDGRAGKSDAINDWLNAVMEDTGAGDGEE